jgi:hypothetical protein
LDSIAYNLSKKAIVKGSKKRKRVDADSAILCTNEESLLDIESAKFNDFFSRQAKVQDQVEFIKEI